MIFKKTKNYILLLFLLISQILISQVPDNIEFTNPSFEGKEAAGQLPNGWYNCGAKKESPPDTQPGAFGVLENPQEGFTYLGMVVRKIGTWESACTKLSSPLKKGNCYSFSIHLARSDTYNSLSQFTNKMMNFSEGVLLRVWAGKEACSKEQLLVTTHKIIEEHWHKYKLVFNVNSDYQFLTFEAVYDLDTLEYYCGNLLLDNLSVIKEIDCELVKEAKPKLKKADFLKMSSKDQLRFITHNYPVVYEKAYDTDDFRKKLMALFAKEIIWDFEQIGQTGISADRKIAQKFIPILNPKIDFSFFVLADCLQRMKQKKNLVLIVKFHRRYKFRLFRNMLFQKLKEQNLDDSQFQIIRFDKKKQPMIDDLSENNQLIIGLTN